MPSTPKKNLRTGSVLLGRELRRLRGNRTLSDICKLTTSPGLTGRVAPIAMATLSELESGKALPQLSTLHALSVVYKVSMSQLMAYVTEEKLAGQQAVEIGSTDRSDLASLFAEKLHAAKWEEALQVSLTGERTARTEAARIAWRSNRASCLMRLGMGREALDLLTECCESSVPDAEQRFYLFKSLAYCHADSGDVSLAEIMAREARNLADAAALDRSATVQLDFLRAQVALLRIDAGHDMSERTLREHLRLIEGLLECWDAADACNVHRLRQFKCRLLLALGNALVAGRDAELALAAARALGNPDVLATALETLAIIRADQRDRDAALSLLEEARKCCEVNGVTDRHFDINFRIFLLLKEVRPGVATAAYRRCEELFPLLPSRTALARQFESISRMRG